MRLTDFWERMTVAFGPHADSLADHHVLRQLDCRTVREALADGVATKDVWRAVCEGLEVADQQR